MSDTRSCQTTGCTHGVTRGGERGPWPKYCRQCRLKREAVRRRQAAGSTLATCADCPVVFDVPTSGVIPARCETCTRVRKRKQAAARQARWRSRHGKSV
jgi:hypothetical protein